MSTSLSTPSKWRTVEALSGKLWRLSTARRYPIAQEGLLLHGRLTGPRRRNLALQAVNRRLLGLREVALPHILHVGVTTLCNLRCPACPTGTEALGRPGEHLDFDVYRRTLEELRDALMLMLFWDWGEPLMHPKLPEMIAAASGAGIMSVISTNATVANSERHIERLVAAQPSVVIVCADGADQQTYEQYRVGGKLEKVLDTARRLEAARRRMGLPYPLIEFRSLATRENEHQMAQLLGLARACGADLFSVKSLRPYDYRGASVDAQLVPLNTDLSRYSYSNGPDAGARLDDVRQGPLTCAKPHYSPTLNSSGELVFCSYAGHEMEHFGDVSTRGFRAVWRDRRSREIRMHFDRVQGTPSCTQCYFRTEDRPTILHQVPLRPLPPHITAMWPKTAGEFLGAVDAPRIVAGRAHGGG